MHVDALGDPWDDIGSGAALEVSEVAQGHLTDVAILEQDITGVFWVALCQVRRLCPLSADLLINPIRGFTHAQFVQALLCERELLRGSCQGLLNLLLLPDLRTH